MKRTTLIVLGGLALFASCGSQDSSAPQGASPGQGPPPESLLLVTIDTLRADHVGAYGDRKAATPSIDGLAAGGVRFASASCVAPLTLPSHTSIMTGTLPPYHGVRDNLSQPARAELVTLAEKLQGAGFHTGAFTGAFVLDPINGLDQGFDVYTGVPQLLPEPENEFEERRAVDVNSQAVAWLEELAQGEPFFMWVHYFEPHQPWPSEDRLPARYKGRPYAAEIQLADQALGQLLEHLERLGRRAETLVVLTSDHGEGLGEHGEPGHSYFTYESTLNVPLIFQHPSLSQGYVAPVRVSLIDVMPTLLGVFGLSPLELAGCGASLVPELHGQASPARPVYFESWMPLMGYGWAPIQGLTLEGMKYIRLPRPELYALDEDPRELKNLYATRAADAQRLSAALDQVLEASLGAQGASAAAHSASNAGALADPKDGLEKLAKIEYVEHLLEHENLQDAESALVQLLRDDPDSPIVNLQFGLLLMKFKRHSDAVPLLQKSLQHGMTDASTLTRLGICHFKSGGYADSLTAFDDALRQNSKHLSALYWKGQVLAAMGRDEQAGASYQRILDLWGGPQTGPQAGLVQQVRDLQAKLNE